MKRDHPFTGMKEKDLATSAERFTTACHTLARMNDFHPLAPSRSDAHIHSETRGKGSTYTHTHTWYINNGNICFKFKPDWPDFSHHLFLFAPHDSCISISLFFFVPVSPTLITAKLDLYSLLPLSLVSLSRNRTKGGRRSSSLYWGFDMKSVLSNLMEFCVWQCVLWCVGVCSRLWCIWCMEVPEASCWQCASLHKNWLCKNSLLYPCLNVCFVIFFLTGGKLTSNNHSKVLCGVVSMLFGVIVQRCCFWV